MRAATAGRVELAALLLDRGANLDKPNWAWFTALLMAAVQGHDDVVELFLRQGARRELLDAIAMDDAPLVRGTVDRNNGRVPWQDSRGSPS
jgi:ankyrin repeat protein